jgi:hypothetical protein
VCHALSYCGGDIDPLVRCKRAARPTTKIVCTKEAWVPYLEKGGVPPGWGLAEQEFEGGGGGPARASRRLLRGSFAENWDRPKRETLVKPLERQGRRESLKRPTK